ncbi:MAG: ABC transporter substrate-binding protein [Pseudomonadota bacterium]
MLLVRHESPLAQVSFIDLPNRDTAVRELLAGQLDALSLPMDEVLQIASRHRFKVVAAINLATGLSALMSRPEIADLREIRGKRIGLTGDAGSLLLLNEALREAGLTDRNAVERIILPQDFFEHPPAGSSPLDNLDVLAVQEPYRSQRLAEGWQILLDSTQIPGGLADLVVVRQEALETHSEALRDLLRHLSSAIDALTLEPDDAMEQVASSLGLEPEVLATLLEGINWAEAETNHQIFEGSCGSLCQSAEQTAEILAAEGFLREVPPLAHFFDGRFLPAPPP